MTKYTGYIPTCYIYKHTLLVHLFAVQQAMDQGLPSFPAGIYSHCPCLVTLEGTEEHFTGITEGTQPITNQWHRLSV